MRSTLPGSAACLDEKEFNARLVVHRILDATVDRLDELAYANSSTPLILLVGPTGVGKSAALRTLANRRRTEMKATQCSDADCPAICVEADAPEKGSFNFSSLYVDALKEMNAPMAQRSRLPRSILRDGDSPNASELGNGCGALRSRLRHELEVRNVQYMSIDEAANIFKIGRYRSSREREILLAYPMDSLRSLVNKSNSALVLGGSFDLFRVYVASAQIARRTTFVLMRPYSELDDSDIADFAVATTALLGCCPAGFDGDPADAAAELISESLGCIGTAKGFISRASRVSMRKGKPLNGELIRQQYFPPGVLRKMRAELEDGLREMNLCLDEFAHPASTMTGAQRKSKGRVGERVPSYRKQSDAAW